MSEKTLCPMVPKALVAALVFFLCLATIPVTALAESEMYGEEVEACAEDAIYTASYDGETLYNAYYSVLSQAKNAKGVFSKKYMLPIDVWADSIEYAVFDINRDGTPELLVRCGFSAAGMSSDYFTLGSGGSAKHLGSSGWYGWYEDNGHKLYGFYVQHGVSSVYRLNIAGSGISETLVASGDAYANQDYLDSLGAHRIDVVKASNYSLLEKARQQGIDDGRLFPDVPTSHWAAKVIGRAVSLGLLSGYSNGRFGPEDNITRGQAAVILWNMAGKPEPAGNSWFSDVSSGAYYYKAVRWAAGEGIVSGYGGGKFGPNDKVTREQLAVMLANYAAKWEGLSASGDFYDFSHMSDAGSVSGWARPAVGWCFRQSILSGSGGRVNPKGKATRAEAAKMFVKLYDVLN